MTKKASSKATKKVVKKVTKEAAKDTALQDKKAYLGRAKVPGPRQSPKVA